MKIEIEIPDLEEIYNCTYEDEGVTGKDLKRVLVDVAIEKFIDQLYAHYVDNQVYLSLAETAKQLVKDNSTEIIEKVTTRVTDTILLKKAIVNEMPKKKEVADISKEWEQYFIELIDKAIAKRFKG